MENRNCKILKNLEITDWKYLLSDIHRYIPLIPESFEAEIVNDPNIIHRYDLIDMAAEIKNELIGDNGKYKEKWLRADKDDFFEPKKYGVWIPDLPSNTVVTERKFLFEPKNKLGEEDGFIALVVAAERYYWLGGGNEFYGVYGIKKKGARLVGKLIDYDHRPARLRDDDRDYERYVLDKIEDGVLKYKYRSDRRYKYIDQEYDLNKLIIR